MVDSVKFIFRTLLRVPIIIAVVYLCLNVFSFTVNYIRLYSLSQVAINTAMENNYIPQNEFEALLGYADTLTNPIMNRVDIMVGTDAGDVTGTRRSDGTVNGIPFTQWQRGQYGQEVTVSVTGSFLWLLPIPWVNNNEFAWMDRTEGMGGGPPSVVNDAAAMQAELDRRGLGNPETAVGWPRQNITFTYTVPGLKYYPDIDAGP